MRSLLITPLVILAVQAPLNASADLAKGWNASNAGDYATAAQEFKKVAKQGDAYAQYLVGLMYANGRGVIQDDKQAVKWYRLAAEQGDARAQADLGVMYRYGNGVMQDDKEAVKWYRLSAEQGDAMAQVNLGNMHRKGEGVLQDKVYAHMWYNIAAFNGDEFAKGNRDIIVKQMTPSQIAEAQKLARECVTKDYNEC